MTSNRVTLLCVAAFGLACAEARDPVGIAPRPNAPLFHLPIGGQSVVTSGIGTPTIDGVFSPGEWANAAAVSFAANVPPTVGGGTTPAVLYVLNDGTNLYLALKVASSSLDISAAFEFDNDHAGGTQSREGDDALVISLHPSAPASFADVFRSGLPPCPPGVGVACGFQDADMGGTVDGAGAGSNDATFAYVEIWHPLDSPDDAHDFSLTPGEVVGFHLSLRLLAVGSLADTELPAPDLSPAHYADLKLAIPEIPVSIDVKPGAEDNTINLKSEGKTPVAILGSATFDATTVDPSTVQLAGAPVARKPNGTRMAQVTDVNGDGRADVLLHIETPKMQLGVGLVDVVLTGATFGGQAIRGSDRVNASEPPVPQVASVVVTPPTALLRILGATQQFGAQALDRKGTPLAVQPTFTWSSSNAAVAVVDVTGRAGAVTTGRAIITATASGGPSGSAVLDVDLIDPVVAFRQAWVGLDGGSDGVVVLGGLLADEWTHSGTSLTRSEVDRRAISSVNGTVSTAYSALVLARNLLELEAARLESSSPTNPRIGHLRTLAGYAYLGFAENFCSGVPLDNPNVGMSTADLFGRAVTRFEQARGGPNDGAYVNLARVGLARAYLALGKSADAAAVAASVPTSFAFNTTQSSNPGEENDVYVLNVQQREISLADQEGTNGLPFRSAADSRTPWASAGFGQNGVSPQFNLLKYPSAASPLTLGSGLEARLIEAEVSLRAGNIPAFIAGINSLRATIGLAAIPDPGTLANAVDVMFRERAFWLFGTGQRLGDLRRLTRQYGRTPTAGFPVGAYPLSGFYGADVNLPVPLSAAGPEYTGCTDRNP